jgi:hypothetical protein
MAWTFSNLARKAAADGIAALLNSGTVLLSTSGDVELAVPTFGATAFGAATNASPAVATANAFTADSSITAGTIGKIALRNSSAVAIMSGTVGVGTGDFQVADAVIPSGATSVNITSLTLSVSLS